MSRLAFLGLYIYEGKGSQLDLRGFENLGGLKLLLFFVAELNASPLLFYIKI